jgi:hypothetical protein
VGEQRLDGSGEREGCCGGPLMSGKMMLCFQKETELWDHTKHTRSGIIASITRPRTLNVRLALRTRLWTEVFSHQARASTTTTPVDKDTRPTRLLDRHYVTGLQSEKTSKCTQTCGRHISASRIHNVRRFPSVALLQFIGATQETILRARVEGFDVVTQQR